MKTVTTLASLFLAVVLSTAAALAQAPPPRLTGGTGPLPLFFESNSGRYGEEIRFVARARSQTVFLHAGGYDVGLRESAPTPDRKVGSDLVRVHFVGADAAPALRGESPLPTRVNHFLGKDPARWSVDNRTFSQVRYHDLWAGIDLVFYDRGGDLEYDFALAPGADPGRILLRFEGDRNLALGPSGELVVSTAVGDLLQSAPVLTQEGRPLDGRWKIVGPGLVGFEVEGHDPGSPLLIDPVLQYVSYLGGSSDDKLFDVTADGAGSAYVCGKTISVNLPTGAGSYQPSLAAGTDAYVARLSPQGDQLMWCTYLGGLATGWSSVITDEATAIALDGAGNVVVAGLTECTDFPTTSSAYQQSYGGFSSDGFVAKLAATGNALLWSTYIGGADSDQLYGLAITPGGDAVVAGSSGNGYPTTAGAYQTTQGAFTSAVVTCLDGIGGSSLIWSTYLGGSGGVNQYGRAVAVDGAGRVYVAGATASATFPVVGGFQTDPSPGQSDGFLARLDATGSTLEYSTYIGSSAGEMSSWENGPGLAIDGAGGAWFAGWVAASSFPISANAFDPSIFGSEGLAVLVDTSQAGMASLVHATYAGGSGSDRLWDAAIGPQGEVWLAGSSGSSDFPVSNAIQPCHRGADDVVLVELSASGALQSSTYLGSTGGDANFTVGGLHVDAAGSVYLVNRTSSQSGLATFGSYQGSHAGGTIDGWVAKLWPSPAPTASATVRLPCIGNNPASSLVPVSGGPVIGSSFAVAIDDPLAQSGLNPMVMTSTFWFIASQPMAGYPCGLAVFGAGPGGSLGEIFISITPPDPFLILGPQPWNGPGNPSIHTVPIPCDPRLAGLALYTQGAWIQSLTSIVVTDGLDLVIGS